MTRRRTSFGRPKDKRIEHFYRCAYLAECNDAMARMYCYSAAEELVGARLGAPLLPFSILEDVEYLKAFVRSVYRLNVLGRNLLNWLRLVLEPSKTGGMMQEISWEGFERVAVRVGRVPKPGLCPRPTSPPQSSIDFGPGIGIRRSSAQITAHYVPEELPGRQVVAVVSFPPKRSAGFESQMLILGVSGGEGAVVLLAPDREVPLGRAGCSEATGY